MSRIAKYSLWCIYIGFSIVCIVLPFFTIGNGMLIGNQSMGNTFFLLFTTALIGILFSLFILFSDRYIYSVKLHLIDLLLIFSVLFLLINSQYVQNHITVSYRLYDLVALTLFYLAVRFINPKSIILLFAFVVIGALLQAIYGELQLYKFYPSLNTNFPITGSFFNPGPYSGYLTTVFPVAVGLYLFIDQLPRVDVSRYRRLIKYISAITILVVILVLSVTTSRAAWLALFFSSSFLLFFRYRWNIKFRDVLNTHIKRLIGFSLGFIILLAIGLGLYYLKQDSADGRTLIWKASWGLIQDNPWIGLGFDRFQAGYMESQAAWFRDNPDDPAAPLADDVAYAFNEGVQLLVEQGMIGFALVLLLLIAVFQIRGKMDNPEIWIAQAGLISILIFGMFSYPSHILPIKICGAFYLAILAGKSCILVEWRDKRNRRAINGIIAMLAFIAALAAFRTSNRLFQAVKDWNYAYTLYQGAAFGPAVEIYEKALPMYDQNGEFLTNYGKALAMAGKHREAILVLVDAKKYLGNTVIQTTLGDSYMELRMYEQAESAYHLAADMLPDRFYPRYLLVKLYFTIGAWDKMEPLAKDLLEKKPKVASRAVEEIKSEMERLLEVMPSRLAKFEPEYSLSP